MSYIGKFESGENLYRIGSTLFGTCNTAANIAEKEIVMPDFDALVTGITIYVLFENSNIAQNAVLKFNDGTEVSSKEIYKNKNKKVGITPNDSWSAGSVVSFTFDGNV